MREDIKKFKHTDDDRKCTGVQLRRMVWKAIKIYCVKNDIKIQDYIENLLIIDLLKKNCLP